VYNQPQCVYWSLRDSLLLGAPDVPRVVPSDVVKAADRLFPDMAANAAAFPQMAHDQLPWLAALAELVDAVPQELIVLEPTQYAAFIASVACIKAMGDVFQSSRAPASLALRLRGYDENPIFLIRAAMRVCPDEAPSPQTAELSFIRDQLLRDSIRQDISAANQALAEGGWKGATVLAGSAVEALLLWALQEHEAQHVGARAAAITTLLGNRTLTRQPDANPERWDLHEYVEIAAQLGIITADTAAQTRLARRFRDLIHPGRATRLGQKCDRATALGALAAVEAVARDLTR
jgi:hypothetical protein